MVSGFCAFSLVVFVRLLYYFSAILVGLVGSYFLLLICDLSPRRCGRCVFPVPRCGGGSCESLLQSGLADIFSPPLLVR